MRCQDATREIFSALDSSCFSPELREHLADCTSCASLVAQSATVDSLFLSAPVHEPNPFLWTRIETRLAKRSPAQNAFYLLRLPVSAWLTLSALILFSFLLSIPQNQLRLSADQMLAQNELASSAQNLANPFLAAQTGGADGNNPFLQAMAAGRSNPFQVQLRRLR